jgi:hypothetical protein
MTLCFSHPTLLQKKKMYGGNMHQVPMEPQKDKRELGDEITM